MSNPAFSIGLVVEGVDLQEAVIGYGLEVVRGLDEASDIIGSDQVPLGGTGSFARNRKKVGRLIEIRGIVKGSSPSDYRVRVKALQALFNVTAYKTVVCLLEDGTTATIEARAESLVWNKLNGYTAMLSVEMRAVAAEWTIT